MFTMKTLQCALTGAVLAASLPLTVMAQGKEPVKIGLGGYMIYPTHPFVSNL